MRSPDLLLTISDLVGLAGPDGTDALHRLLKTVAQNGLLPTELLAVLDGILHSTTSASNKNILASECLIPDGNHLLPTELVGRVLGAVGTPEIYYKNGKQHKLKRLLIATIQRLLEWLVCALPSFGKGVFRVLRRFLPMLFGLLPFEFLRPYIATLIVVATSSSDAVATITTRSAVRPWHLQLVADLSAQFPSDPSLHGLLAYIRLKDRTQRVQSGAVMEGFKSTGNFADARVPNSHLHLQILAKFQGLTTLLREVLEVERQLRRFFSSFELQGTKRRRIGPLYDLLPTQLGDALLIMSVTSVSSLIAQFEKIDLPNPSSVLSLTSAENNKYRRLYLALYLLGAGQNDQTAKKLRHAVQSHIFGEGSNNSLLVFTQLLEFARFQGLQTLSGPCIQYINNLAVDKDQLKKQIRLLRHLPWEKSVLVSAIVKIISLLQKEEWTNIAGLLFEEIAFIITKWRSVFLERDSFPEYLSCLLDILSHLFALAEALWTIFNLESKLKFLGVLKAVKDTSLDHSWPTAGLLVPPPTLMYLLIVSTNPLILSEALGYLVFLKSVPIPDEDSKTIALRNNYVMDSINFVWRDMALKKEADTFSTGMFLDDEFLQKVSALNFFSYSNFIQLKTVGGVVQNPSLVYICAELVWKLEDQVENITTRHPGPISEESVLQLRQDPDNTWLPMSYYDIKISLLNSLDRLGYSGLCDFLFTSLKSLENQRRAAPA